jgi:hypothetical protein
MFELLARPKTKAKTIRPSAVCPNGIQISITARTVINIVKIAMLYRPYVSAKYPGRQRPNTDPTFQRRKHGSGKGS